MKTKYKKIISEKELIKLKARKFVSKGKTYYVIQDLESSTEVYYEDISGGKFKKI